MRCCDGSSENSASEERVEPGPPSAIEPPSWPTSKPRSEETSPSAADEPSPAASEESSTPSPNASASEPSTAESELAKGRGDDGEEEYDDQVLY